MGHRRAEATFTDIRSALRLLTLAALLLFLVSALLFFLSRG